MEAISDAMRAAKKRLDALTKEAEKLRSRLETVEREKGEYEAALKVMGALKDRPASGSNGNGRVRVGTVRDTILQVMQGHPGGLSTVEVAENATMLHGSEITKDTAYRALYNLRERDHVELSEDHLWSLKSSDDDPADNQTSPADAVL